MMSRYLEDDPCVRVIERRSQIRGYELYLVEQWGVSRLSPTLVVVTYTGDEKHSVVVGVLSVPSDETLWSTKLRVYFKATRQYMARPKETALGELMVTNLSSFSSSLTVIPVPDGDIRKHRQMFIVNENLKRLGCSGRSGLTLTEPAEGTQAKFLSIYKISEKVPFYVAVVELVKLCQVALYMFEKLDQEYIDGLLCDMTERAIGNWWTEVGAEHYNYEPNDGILGPSTVAALLGMLMGARNRLYWYGAPVAKDVFDVENTKRGIAHFQKSQKLERTRRLDRPTLLRLHAVTAKAAAGEGWGVQKAVKSRMTEIGGKRGEIVMGMVSGKDKGGLADVETLDIDRFIQFVYGERAKWLWLGKPRRIASEQQTFDSNNADDSYKKDEPTSEPMSRTQTANPAEDDLEPKRKEDMHPVYSDIPPGSATSISDSPEQKDALRRTVLKSVAGKMSDARSGFGRIKDAVGGARRGHNARPSISAREDLAETGHLSQSAGTGHLSQSAGTAAMLPSPSVAGINRSFTWNKKPEEYLAAMKRGEYADGLPKGPAESRDPSSSTVGSRASKQAAELMKDLKSMGSEVRETPVAESAVDDTDLQGPALEAERKDNAWRLQLFRRHSVDVAEISLKHILNENRWPRRMSFGHAEDAILTWEEIVDITDTAGDAKAVKAMAEIAQHLHRNIDDITYNVEPWVEGKIKALEILDERYAREKDELQNIYHQLNDACQRVRYNSGDLVSEERARLTAGVKDVEMLVAKLDYEINALVQKVADVEDGIHTFERQVEDVEKRAQDLKSQLETESWLHWFVRTLTGVGTGPNITRETES
jgi:hypothetical protein